MNLKTKRKEKKMSQVKVAKACGITQCAYSNYEIGKRQPKPMMLKKIAEIFECSVDELLKDNDDKGRIGKTAGRTAQKR